MSQPTSRIVILGGGITGLAAAYALLTDKRWRDLGFACTIVERDSRLGGKVQTEHVEGCLVETGPDSFLATKPWAADLCRALGLGDRLIGTLPGRAVYVASRGRLHPLPQGLMVGVPTRMRPMVGTSLLTPSEKARLALDLVLPRRPAGGDESMGSFIGRRLGRAAVDRLAGPLLSGIYAGDVDALSVVATFPQLRQWETEHRSVILAALRHRRSAPAGGRAANPMFLGLAGGLRELIDALVTALRDATIMTGQPVVRVDRHARDGTKSPDQPGSYVVHLGDGRSLEATALLFTTPTFVTADLLAPLAPGATPLLRAIPYASTAAVTLAYQRAQVSHPLDGHGFVVARGEPLAITACTWVSSKWPHRAPPGIALLRCYLGSAGRDAIVEEDDERLVAAARVDLATTMGIQAVPLFTHVARWRRAMPQYLPGHLDRLEAIDAEVRHLPPVALAGAGYRGIGLPDCIRQGTEAARRLVDTLGAARPGILTG